MVTNFGSHMSNCGLCIYLDEERLDNLPYYDEHIRFCVECYNLIVSVWSDSSGAWSMWYNDWANPLKIAMISTLSIGR